MRVFVDPEICREHGQCEIAAPDVFQLDPASGLTYDSRPDGTFRKAVEEAVDACPEQAISIIEHDPPAEP